MKNFLCAGLAAPLNNSQRVQRVADCDVCLLCLLLTEVAPRLLWLTNGSNGKVT